MSDFAAGDSSESSSQEERIKYLRERGVVIEFPEDRKKTIEPSDLIDIVIVKIPCEETEPYSEVRVKISRTLQLDGVGDQLLEVLKYAFATAKRELLDEDALVKSAEKQLGIDSQSVRVSSDTIQALGRQGSVEAFALSHPCEANNFSRVSLYLDEVGALKQLPLNRRAAALANTCGYNDVPLFGDMYLGRTRIDRTGIHNVDFLLSDVDSNAAWLQGIVKQNYERGMETNKIDMGSSATSVQKEEKGYKWMDAEDNVELTLPLPAGTSKKDVAVKFSSKNVCVSLRSTSTVLLDIALYDNVVPDESTWTLSKGELELTLCKRSVSAWYQLEADV